MTESSDTEPQVDGESPVLPDVVRRKVAAYAGQVIRGLKPNQVPSALRFATRWRPGAMPRGFAERVMEELAADSAFRELVGAQLVDGDPLAQAVASGSADPASDPAAMGAVLYLVQPAGWGQRLESVVAALAATATPSQELQAAQEKILELRAKLDREQERHQRELAALKQKEAEGRASLSQAADRLRLQVVELKDRLASAEAARDDYERESNDLDRAVRKLKAQLAQIKGEAGLQRAEQRDARLAATARAKVLLDVLQGAAAGLAAELALPAGTPAPADLVDADAPADPTFSKRLNTPAELTLVLGAPRSHLIVDGYNVSKGMWPNSALAQQRERLITSLTALQSRTGAEVTVVFDGADVGGVPAVTSRTVRVRFSRPGEPADRVIVRLVDADTTGRPLVVASSDGALTSGARNAGARTVDSDVLRSVLASGR